MASIAIATTVVQVGIEIYGLEIDHWGGVYHRDCDSSSNSGWPYYCNWAYPDGQVSCYASDTGALPKRAEGTGPLPILWLARPTSTTWRRF